MICVYIPRPLPSCTMFRAGLSCHWATMACTASWRA